MKILFLSLNTFSSTGGIQSFNRCMQLALSSLAAGEKHAITHFSLHDSNTDFDERYHEGTATVEFRGFGGNRLAFIRELWAKGSSVDKVIYGHINLSPLALLPPLRNRVSWLVAHGIEVWKPLSALKKRGLRKMDRILAVSRFTISMLEKSGLPVPGKVQYFPNCLDPFFEKRTISPAQEWNRYWRLPTGATFLLTVARISSSEKDKGYDDVIRCLPKLAQQFPRIFYLVAGKADETEKARIMALAESLGVSNRVILPGFVPDEHLPALYNLAKLFVMPSRKEGFGIVFMEAAWWGCPVVACNAGGASEALLGGKLGTLVTPGNNDELCKAMGQHLALESDKPTLMQHNRELLSKHFSFSLFRSGIKEILHPS